MTEYDLINEIFKMTYSISLMLSNEPHNERLFGAWEGLLVLMDKAGVLCEYNKWRDKQ